MTSMFETLMELPLFKGVSRDRMAATVGAHRFHFLKYMPGEVIFRAGEPCSDLSFVISGSVCVRIDINAGISVEYTLDAPETVAPDFLFGRHTWYPGTVASVGATGLLRISKGDYLDILKSDPVFMLNYLNLLSMNAQKALEGIMAAGDGALTERMASWIGALTPVGSRDIVLRCPCRGLASVFGVPCASLEQTLEGMSSSGLITCTDASIMIPDRRALMSLMRGHNGTAGDRL